MKTITKKKLKKYLKYFADSAVYYCKHVERSSSPIRTKTVEIREVEKVLAMIIRDKCETIVEYGMKEDLMPVNEGRKTYEY